MAKKLKTYVSILILVLVIMGCNNVSKLPPLPKKDPLFKVVLYYPSPDGINGVTTEIPKSELTPVKVLEKLIIKDNNRPEDKAAFTPFLPRKTKILGVDIDKDGVASINFSRDVLNLNASKKLQRYAIAAIVKTVTQAKEIKWVKFKVEGREKGKIKVEGVVKGALEVRNIEDWWGKVSLKEQPWK